MIGRLLKVLAAGALWALAACATGPAAQSEVDIRWDRWGVPHIRAGSDADLAYGLGWAQVRGRPDLVLRLMGQGRGRASEYWGQAYRDSDELLWRLGVPQSLPALYAAHSPAERRSLDAFAQAINDYAAAHPSLIDDEVERVLPVSALDVLGHTQRTMHVTFVLSGEVARRNAEIVSAGEAPGSNAWAIAPARSESGHAMLLSNPHLPWSGLYYFYEAHLTGPDVDTYGVSLIGLPFLVIAFNDQAGWTHTVNTYDGADTFRFARSGEGYRADGVERAFEIERVTLRERGADGALTSRELELKRTLAGPVLHETATHVYATRVAGLADPARARLAPQYWAMARARDTDAFEAAMAMQQAPMFNTVYADAHGDIFYLFNALAPVRARGDARFWRGVIDASDSSIVWRDYARYEALPRFRNPRRGFIQNANEPPWTASPGALDPGDYPSDFEGPALPARPQNSLAMLLADERISYAELQRYILSTRLVSADNLMDDLLTAARDSPDPLVQEAAAVLEAWDRQSEAQSRGAVLYAAWARAFDFDAGDYREPWRFETATQWPRGLRDGKGAAAALRTAAEQVRAAYGRLDVTWGEAAPIEWRGSRTPAGLGLGALGAFRVGFLAAGAEGRYRFLGGTSYVATTEFADRVRAHAILPYGNFENPPPGVADQVALLARGEMRKVHFTDAEIEAATIERELLAPGLD